MAEIKRISENDIDAVAVLESEIFSDSWSAKSIKETYDNKSALILGAYQDEELIGYVIFYYVLDEGEIARIAVSPSHRRQGVAEQIFAGLLEFCEENNIERILLDVRISNEPAISFYRKSGFADDGIRKNFYENPKEHALLMSAEVAR
jgi:ribosomal-protein-alanine N-acetyltransferase